MESLFADTQGWVALTNKRDEYHVQAVKVKRRCLEQERKFVTTNFVLDETYTLLKARMGYKSAIEFGEMIRQANTIDIVHISEEVEDEAWQLFRRYSDKGFSFTDCTSFVIMQRNGLSEAFTNDHHFEQIGYSVLLK